MMCLFWASLTIHGVAASCASSLDETSMLQMPVVENSLSAEASECRCPGYFQEECEAEAEYGCMWTDAGDSNAPHCQCREILEPGWVAPPRIVQAHQLPVTHPDHHSVQLSWNNHMAAFGVRNMDMMLADYTEDSVITVYNRSTGSNTVYSGLDGVRTVYTILFASLDDMSDFAVPVMTIKEASAHAPGSVFLIWTAAASGYSYATDTFVFDGASKILFQNAALSYLDPHGDGSITMVDDTEAPTGSGPVHDGWANHYAAFTGQDVDMIMADYVEESEITVYNSADGSSTVFSGLDAVRECFVDLFANLGDTSNLNAPIVHVDEATPDKTGQVFWIWDAPASGYQTATETLLFNMVGKITRQHVVVHYFPVGAS